MFRRRRRQRAEESEDVGEEQSRWRPQPGAPTGEVADSSDGGWPWGRDDEDRVGTGSSGQGPWDVTDRYPERDRADFGSLLVPITPTQDIELAADGERVVWVTVRDGGSELRIQAFAAPKSRRLWEEVRHEIVGELASTGAPAQESDGPFGPEIFAHVPVQPGNPAAGTMPVRFIGVDGPRWLLRGLIIGPAASGHESAAPLEDVLRDVVVVRGDHPMPPRELLELRLPPDLRQALEQQAMERGITHPGGTADQASTRFPSAYLDPFQHGPEFTDSR